MSAKPNSNSTWWCCSRRGIQSSMVYRNYQNSFSWKMGFHCVVLKLPHELPLSRYETTASLLAFLLALGLRFIRLGELPLTNSEARLALDALQIAQGGSPALSSHVAYTNLTAILFFLVGSFNFLARFWPALVGSALVFVPLLFREQIAPPRGHSCLLLRHGSCLCCSFETGRRTHPCVDPPCLQWDSGYAINRVLLAFSSLWRFFPVLFSGQDHLA